MREQARPRNGSGAEKKKAAGYDRAALEKSVGWKSS